MAQEKSQIIRNHTSFYELLNVLAVGFQGIQDTAKYQCSLTEKRASEGLAG